MATYKGIKGVKVQSKASDPTASEADGTVWYNTATTALKYSIDAGGAWSSASNLNLGRESPGGARNGTQSAGMIFGGNSPGAGYNDQTEQYNGTSWTEVNDLIKGRSEVGGLGTNTAAMAVGGNYPDDGNYSEIWDGTSWSEVADLNNRRVGGQATGTTTAGIVSGGSGPTTGGTKSETWNGTSWTAVNDLSRGAPVTFYGTTCGTNTAALYYGGGAPASASALNEIWNGTCWSESGGDMNTGRFALMGFGITTAALAIGGSTGPGAMVGNTEKYNGSTWTESGDLGTARDRMAGGGTTSSGVIGGGVPESNAAEEWNDPAYVIKTVTVS